LNIIQQSLEDVAEPLNIPKIPRARVYKKQSGETFLRRLKKGQMEIGTKGFPNKGEDLSPIKGWKCAKSLNPEVIPRKRKMDPNNSSTELRMVPL